METEHVQITYKWSVTGAGASIDGDDDGAFVQLKTKWAHAGEQSFRLSVAVTWWSGTGETTYEGDAGATLNQVATGSKKWDVGTPIGERKEEDGTTTNNGRMMKPDNHTLGGGVVDFVKEHTSTGGTLPCEVEAATDDDDWEMDDADNLPAGSDADTVSYKWTSTFVPRGDAAAAENAPEGSFADANAPSTTWTAPAVPGSYRLTCTIEDGKTVVAPDTGARDDTALVRSGEVNVLADTDSDGVPNQTGEDGGGTPDTDIDGDGIDNQTGTNGGGTPDADIDGDGVPNGTDNDIDGDGIVNGDDRDVDGDGVSNGDDTDIDGDGTPNQPGPSGGGTPDPDIDADGVPNATDGDIDGDGILNGKDADMDGDGVPNDTDTDFNADGTIDGKVWTTPTAIAGGALTKDKDSVLIGKTLDVSIDEATDRDHWTRANSAGDEDDEITYEWTAVEGTFIGDRDKKTAQWQAPAEKGEYKVLCTIDDKATKGAHDTGTRDDAPVVREMAVTVYSALRLKIDDAPIVAGGWNDALKIYGYKLGDNAPVLRGATPDGAPDPHIAIATATLVDANGAPVVGAPVTFTCQMPGTSPPVNETRTTGLNGTATLKIISGDEVSKDVDEATNQVLFNNPVEIKVSSRGEEDKKLIDVVAPKVEWQYKNEAGNYEEWNGELLDIYSDQSRKDIPLRVSLTHNAAPVVGHQIHWGFEKIFDKSEDEVLPDDPDYITYGRMSGSMSTTLDNGKAGATFNRGYNIGQIVFQIEDNSVTTQEPASASSGATTPLGSGQAASDIGNPPPHSAEVPMKKRKKKSKYGSPKYKEYTYVKGVPGYENRWGYPAPAGEEDNELLQNTLTLVQTTLNDI